MATRAATFTSKIRNLKDYHYRIINNLSPQPTIQDIANTLKYFTQTLLSVLKDIPDIPAESYGPRQRDSIRLSIFPNLNYSGLFKAVFNIIDIVPMLQFDQLALGEAVLNVLGCLVPFLEYEILDSLPYTVAATLAVFPSSLHRDTIDLLCSNLLPMTLGFDGCDEPTYASESAAAIMTMIFQHTDNGAFHTQIVETLMSMKPNICKDMLSVIAYGPPAARAPAAHLLFYYWPQLNPMLLGGRGIHYKYVGESSLASTSGDVASPEIRGHVRMPETARAWSPVMCQREKCLNSRKCQAVKMCLNPALAIQSGDKPPPLYICSDCVDQLKRDYADCMVDILLPMSHVSLTCQNKRCKFTNRLAVFTCFSTECTKYNGNRPIRYCEACHVPMHSQSYGLEHVYQTSIPDIWECPPDMRRFLMDAIVSLLKEAQPNMKKRQVEMGEERRHRPADEEEVFEVDDNDDRKLLSRYGVWLLVELCQSGDETSISIEVLSRLLGMLFQWFDATAYLPDDNIGNALERLKPDYVCTWLQDIRHRYFEVVVSSLLPHPVEYARVGGHWDTLASRTSQIKEGLNRFFCLVPYDIITFEIWHYVMPYWLESVRTEVPVEELPELRVLLRCVYSVISKAFDVDMCPLPFNLEKMYQFVSERFAENGAYVQEQALQWLQILSNLGIIIPMHMLFTIFKSGVKTLLTPPQACAAVEEAMNAFLSTGTPPDETLLTPDQTLLTPDQTQPGYEHGELYETEAELNLSCYIMMLDLILKQTELQEIPEHLGIYNETSVDIMELIGLMLQRPWDGTHTCSEDSGSINCLFCRNIVMWHQLVAKLLGKVLPREPVKIPTRPLPKIEEIQPPPKPKTTTLASILLAAARKDTAGEGEITEDKPMVSVCQTPEHLQLLSAFVKHLCELDDPDALFSLLTSINYLCLHGECLNYTVNQFEDVIKRLLSTMLLPGLWKLLQSQNSHLATLGVPLLLHCMTISNGADIVWNLIDQDFKDEDWKIRFAAVERVTVTARHVDPDSVRHNHVIQTTLSYAFCNMIGCMEDVNASVAQKAVLYIETIKNASLNCLCQCLECQFDTVIADRSMILHRVQLLARILPNHAILSWEFFLNRFDTLSLEAQLDLEINGELNSSPTDIGGTLLRKLRFLGKDLSSSDRDSDILLKKINRARFALARTDSVRSVSDSLQGKPPYRRAVSVPVHLIAKQGGSLQKVSRWAKLREHNTRWRMLKEKDKTCLRQQSAPQMRLGRRMTGRFGGLGPFGGSFFQGTQVREFTDEESNFAAVLQKAMDLEGVDRGTVHQLVSLLMKYMVEVNHVDTNDDKDDGKLQNIVLRHLKVLLGYNQTEKAFSVTPIKLRSSPVFNAFLSGLPRVMDKNFKLGNTLLPISLLLLQYCPSPQRYASDYQPPDYTLTLLEPHTRLSWLHSLLIILYKYQITNTPTSNIISTLMQVVINTIDAQHHHVKDNSDDSLLSTVPPTSRHRDASKISATDLEKIQEAETPPSSPQTSGDRLNIRFKAPSAASIVHFTRKKLGMDTRKDVSSRFKKLLKHGKLPDIPRVEQETDSVVDEPTSVVEYEDDDDVDDDVDDYVDDYVDDDDDVEDSLHVTSSSRITSRLTNPLTVDIKMAQQIHEFCDSQKSPSANQTTEYSKSSSTESTKGTSTGGWSEAESTEGESEVIQSPDLSDLEKLELEDDIDDGDQAGSSTTLLNSRVKKTRKTGLTTIELQKLFPDLGPEGDATNFLEAVSARRNRRFETQKPTPTNSTKKAGRAAEGSNLSQARNTPVLEQYDEETMGLCIVVLETFIHREPALATPLLLSMLQTVSRIASIPTFSCHTDGVVIPGNSMSVARQFMRCVLHQLAPNGIFVLLFQSTLEEVTFFKTMATSLVDFNELPCQAPLQYLLEGLNAKKHIATEGIELLLSNLATYMSCIALETTSPMWTGILVHFDAFFRRLVGVLPNPCDMTTTFKIVTAVLKIPGVTNVRNILEPISKILSFALQYGMFKLQHLLDICSLCNRAFVKDRDKLFLTRTVIFELVQGIKFKNTLPDENWLLLVQFVVLDSGGTLSSSNISEDMTSLYLNHNLNLISTFSAECMRQHLNDCMEFIADIHTITRVKGNMKGTMPSLNEDTLGSQLKAGIAQYIALEFTKANGRDNRAVMRYIPWLYHPPTAVQQGPREFIDGMCHMRLLSWILIGSLTHTAVTQGLAPLVCQPVPLESSSHIADHILVIMSGFAEQSKASVLHMSSLFHAFILCQLWTVYCETAGSTHNNNSNNDQHHAASATILDFWGKVTPGILQLLSHSKVLAEMVNLHFLSMMEALQECNSSILAKLFPLWTSILYTFHSTLPGHLQVRVQTCQNLEPPDTKNYESAFSCSILSTWLKRIQFKLGQIEVQSSAATQFYSV